VRVWIAVSDARLLLTCGLPAAGTSRPSNVDGCLRRLARVLADGGDENLAHLRHSSPQLADELEALGGTLARPVRKPQT
jgi:hypothetical protein